MKKVFFTADTHFGHKNILLYEDRPWGNLEDMKVGLINNWNSVVGKDDLIWVLGDFSFRGFEETKEIFDSLNGVKRIILGNHDRKVDHYRRMGWDFVSKYPVLYQKIYMLSHQPLYMNKHMPMINVHGHLHSKTMAGDMHFNVGVECHNYTPVCITRLPKLDLPEFETPHDEIDKLVEKRKDPSVPLHSIKEKD